MILPVRRRMTRWLMSRSNSTHQAPKRRPMRSLWREAKPWAEGKVSSLPTDDPVPLSCVRVEAMDCYRSVKDSPVYCILTFGAVNPQPHVAPGTTRRPRRARRRSQSSPPTTATSSQTVRVMPARGAASR